MNKLLVPSRIDWEESFRASRAGKAAFEQLVQLKEIAPDEYGHLECRVLDSCYHAYAYKYMQGT